MEISSEGVLSHDRLAAMDHRALQDCAKRFGLSGAGSSAALRKRLGGLILPTAFICSITHELMTDPVRPRHRHSIGQHEHRRVPPVAMRCSHG